MKAIAALIILAAVLVPAVAWANAGTALMIHGWFHLVFGNLLIAILEAGLLHGIWKVQWRRGIPVMIGANFASWLGGVALLSLWSKGAMIPIEHGLVAFILALVLAWAITLVLEAPFVAFALRGPARSLRRVAVASLLLQTTSYLLMVGYYAPASHLSLVTDWTVVAAQEFALPDGVRIYYLDEEPGRVCSLEAGQVLCNEVTVLPGRVEAPWLGIFPEDPNTEVAERWILREEESGAVLQGGLVDGQIPWIYEDVVGAEDAPRWEDRFATRIPPVIVHGGVRSGPVPRLGDAWRSPTQAYLDSWRSAGMWVGDHDFQNGSRVAFDTPVIGTSFRRAFQLPGDLLLVELRSGQICLMDLQTHRIARIAWGRSVVPLLLPLP